MAYLILHGLGQCSGSSNPFAQLSAWYSSDACSTKRLGLERVFVALLCSSVPLIANCNTLLHDKSPECKMESGFTINDVISNLRFSYQSVGQIHSADFPTFLHSQLIWLRGIAVSGHSGYCVQNCSSSPRLSSSSNPSMRSKTKYTISRDNATEWTNHRAFNQG